MMLFDMKKYLLDTDTCIYLIKNHPPSVVRFLKKMNPESIYISTITVAELAYGAEKSERKIQNKIALTKFLLATKMVRFGPSEALVYGQIRAGLEAGGNVIGGMDMLIEAQALANGMVLVTNNLREFGRVRGLECESWVE